MSDFTPPENGPSTPSGLSPSARAERLAADKYPLITIDGVRKGKIGRDAYVSGFLDGRSVSAEQIEAAARTLHLREEGDRAADWLENDIETDPNSYAYGYDWREHWRDKARATFRAAGLRIGGDE